MITGFPDSRAQTEAPALAPCLPCRDISEGIFQLVNVVLLPPLLAEALRNPG